MQKRISAVEEIQNKVEQAKSILIVGGGATGLEIVGEIVHYFPDKKVGIV